MITRVLTIDDITCWLLTEKLFLLFFLAAPASLFIFEHISLSAECLCILHHCSVVGWFVILHVGESWLNGWMDWDAICFVGWQRPTHILSDGVRVPRLFTSFDFFFCSVPKLLMPVNSCLVFSQNRLAVSLIDLLLLFIGWMKRRSINRQGRTGKVYQQRSVACSTDSHRLTVSICRLQTPSFDSSLWSVRFI